MFPSVSSAGAARLVRGPRVALKCLPTCRYCEGGSTVLAVCRAAALVQRAWAGDLVQAVADCERAAHLCPGHAKAHHTRVMALKAMGQLQVQLPAAWSPLGLLCQCVSSGPWGRAGLWICVEAEEPCCTSWGCEPAGHCKMLLRALHSEKLLTPSDNPVAASPS